MQVTALVTVIAHMQTASATAPTLVRTYPRPPHSATARHDATPRRHDATPRHAATPRPVARRPALQLLSMRQLPWYVDTLLSYLSR